MRTPAAFYRAAARRIDALILFPRMRAAAREHCAATGADASALYDQMLGVHVCVDNAWRYPAEWRDAYPEVFRRVVNAGRDASERLINRTPEPEGELP
jgi:hypothetical protein